MSLSLYKKAILLISISTLNACAYTAPPEFDFNLGEEKFTPPASYKPLQEAQKQEPPLPASKPWWTIYNNATLNTLIENAFQENPNINQTRARLEQAAAIANISRADLLPNLTISGERSTQNGDNRQPSSFALIGAAGYELDLWGKNRANHKSDLLETQASADDLRAAAITLSASIVETWLTLLSLSEEEIITRKQIDLNKKVMELQKKRYEMGNASLLDYLQQDETVARAEATLPDILSDQDQAMHRLAVLAGKLPTKDIEIEISKLPAPLPLPDHGLPSQLLENRPDINAAWLRMKSAQWATQAAWANRLPSFDLSAAYSTSAAALDSLFNTWLLDLAANIVAPVFDGGARKAEQRRQEAITDERFQAYKGTVLEAVQEVEDSLSRNTFLDQKEKAIRRQLEASQKTLEQAQISYANGRQSYINVLNAISNVQSLELQLVRTRRTLALERVALYRALSGNLWVDHALRNAENNEDMSTTEMVE